MHRRAIFAIARKDALDVILNRSTMVALLTPILLAVVFAVMAQLLGNNTTALLVYDPDNSAVETVLSGAFSNPRVIHADSPQAVAAAFGPDGSHRTTSYAAGLVIPPGFEASLRAGGHPQVRLFVNGDQMNAQQPALLASALASYSRAVAVPLPPASIAVTTVNPPSASVATDLSKFFAMASLLSSFLVGTSLVPGLLIEEKERRTLRVLMVSSASWGDIIAGKVVVGLGYQLVLSAVVLGVTRGFVGQIPLVLLYTVLGSCLSVVLGLLIGSLFKTASAAGAFSGIASFLYVVPVFFAGNFGEALQNNPIALAMRGVPTYYLANGVNSALQNRAVTGEVAVNVAVVLGSAVALFLLAAWMLRRQAVVLSTV